MKRNIIKNTASLYVMNIAKLIIPLITLPYLTRVLSKDCYGIVSYIKAVMGYMQLIIDFGFMLSGTNDIVHTKTDKYKMECEIGDILAAKLLLSGVALISMIVLIFIISILKNNILYTLLAFIVVFLTCFLFDYFFRGIEEMQVIAIRFVSMKSVSAALTFMFVKSDADILWIPVLDIIGSLVAIALVFRELRKREIIIRFTCFKNIISKIKTSALYFMSNFATTAFNVLITLLIGIYASESQVAEWSLCMQLISAAQSLYSPVTDGIYPEMIKNKKISLIKKFLKIFMPIVLVGCIFTFFSSQYILLIVGGEQYVDTGYLLRALIPVLFFSFPAILIGWPALGALERVKEITQTTVFTALFQVTGLIVLIILNKFTLINIALLRGLTEFILFLSRLIYCIRFRKEFN